MHGSSAKQMQMQMINCLSAILTRIDHRAIAVAQPFLPSNFSGCIQQMAQQRLVFPRRLRQRCDVFARHHQHMHSGMRMNVGKGNAALILIHAR